MILRRLRAIARQSDQVPQLNQMIIELQAQVDALKTRADALEPAAKNLNDHAAALNVAVEELQRRVALRPSESHGRWDPSVAQVTAQLARRFPAALGETALHVGNIAQNAYWNALAMQPLGIDSVVLSPDYYHYAACPEWLGLAVDAGVTRQALGSDSFPNFFRFDEAHELRPRWFVSGPTGLVLNYAWLLSQDELDLADTAWSVLQFIRFKATAELTGTPLCTSWTRGDFVAALARLSVADVFRDELEAGFEAHTGALRMLSDLESVDAANAPLPTTWFDAQVQTDELVVMRADGRTVAAGIERPPLPPTTSDLPFADLWHAVLSGFRYRLLYAVSPVHAHHLGVEPYAAYEHGTIRPLPFRDDPEAKAVSDAYQDAAVVMMTNADYLSAETRLELDSDRIHFVPHGFDQAACDRFLRDHGPVASQPTTPTFVAPARHDWLTAPIGNDKGNNIIVEALALLAARGERRPRVLFIDYGADVDATRNLAAERGVSDQIEWSPVLPKNELWHRYLQSHAVLDQFVIPAIGAIGVEALALGRRVLTADNGSLAEFFGSQPPLLAASSPEQLAERIVQVLDDLADEAGVGDSAAAWFRQAHGDEQLRTKLDGVLSALRDAE